MSNRSNSPRSPHFRTSIIAGIGALALLAAAPALLAQGLPQNASPNMRSVQFVPGGGTGQHSFADVVERVKGSVVSIHVSGRTAATVAQRNTQPRRNQPQDRAPGFPFDGIPGLPDDHPFNEFFRNLPRDGQGGPAQPQPSMAQGSGFVISEDGYVVTNNHVIANASRIQLSFDNESPRLDAELIGTDPRTDIALLKIKSEGRKFPFVSFAAKEPRVGDWVIAVGNPFGFGGTVTAGIVSALARSVGQGPYDFLQIDAAVNRGNSGGPTFNMNGEVVGVNTAIYSPSGGNVGIAFAVPATTVVEVVAKLKESGTVSRGWLGVRIQSIDADMAASLGLGDRRGAIINEVTEKGPAEKAGLKSGDVVLSVNNEPVPDSRALARKVASLAPDSVADLRILRDNKEETIKVTLGDLSDATGQRVASADQSRPSPPTQPQITELPELGLSLRSAPAGRSAGSRQGVEIAEVRDGSDAANKGLRAGDLIVGVAGQEVSSPDEISKAVAEMVRLDRRFVLLRVQSGQQMRFVPVQVKRG